MNKLLFFLFVLLLVSCSLGDREPDVDFIDDTEITFDVDVETGLPFNPSQVLTDRNFIVEGEMVDFSLIPQDKPLFKIRIPSGVVYQIVSQPLQDVTYEDGVEIAPHQFQKGMFARATVWLGDETGVQGTPALTSNDLFILVDPVTSD